MDVEGMNERDQLREAAKYITKLEAEQDAALAALRRAKEQASTGVDVTGCRYCRQVEVDTRAALSQEEA